MRFVEKLLKWFKKNERDYPWRTTDDSFHILIAELFLQRTRSDNVEDVYVGFIDEFPTASVILNADKKKIMGYLSHLGLQNKRYEVLMDVCEAYEEYDGDIFSKEVLSDIKGVGEYMINATLCFGENEKLPLVDTNTRRIITRFYGIDVKEVKKKILDILPDKNYVEFNYALLDYAAIICKAIAPRCDQCIIRSGCLYYLGGKEV